jgi:hypothetical protein
MKKLFPYKVFKQLPYIGSVAIKKLPKKSQYAHHPNFLSTVKINHSQIGEGYDLARLGDMEALFSGLSNYDKIDQPADEESLQFTLNYFLGKFKKCGLLDITTAHNEMNKLASSGSGAKRQGIYSRSDPRMMKYLEDYVNLAAIGDVKCVINGSQKDELRAFEANEEGKWALKDPRFFTSYPPEHNFLSCICLGNFVKQFYENSFFKNGYVSAIGDSPQKGCMKYYFDQMRKRPFAYCTDTSKQDSSVPAWFIQAVFDRIISLYDLDEEDRNMFDNVVSNSIYKVINANGQLYLVPRGLGSGDYLTTIMNVFWRFYMVVENYERPLSSFLADNTVIINGDDLIMSSEHEDLDLSSKYAKIKWAGKPVSWEEMDFCSTKFLPDIHYDSLKMRSVLDKRVQKSQALHPKSEMQRLGGLLKIHVDESFYNDVLSRMKNLRDEFDLHNDFYTEYFSYDEIWSWYNISIK